MVDSSQEKTLAWLGSSHKDLTEMPAEVQDVFGYALHLAQHGERHAKAKPFKIPCFQKKSKFGIKTPKQEVDVVVQRLKRLKELLAAR